MVLKHVIGGITPLICMISGANLIKILITRIIFHGFFCL